MFNNVETLYTALAVLWLLLMGIMYLRSRRQKIKEAEKNKIKAAERAVRKKAREERMAAGAVPVVRKGPHFKKCVKQKQKTEEIVEPIYTRKQWDELFR